MPVTYALYFGYMGLIALGVFLITGTIGFFSRSVVHRARFWKRVLSRSCPSRRISHLPVLFLFHRQLVLQLPNLRVHQGRLNGSAVERRRGGVMIETGDIDVNACLVHTVFRWCK